MRTLVLGGIRSGKSSFAESLIAGSVTAGETVTYLATAAHAADDPAWEHRVAEHRKRRPSWWHTVETCEVATQLRSASQKPALVDDLGNWLTAALDRRGWDGASIDADVADLTDAVRDFAAPLVLVSPEVGLTVVPATAAGRRFADELGTLNQRLAQCCERVVLVVAGQPLWVKPAAKGSC